MYQKERGNIFSTTTLHIYIYVLYVSVAWLHALFLRLPSPFCHWCFVKCVETEPHFCDGIASCGSDMFWSSAVRLYSLPNSNLTGEWQRLGQVGKWDGPGTSRAKDSAIQLLLPCSCRKGTREHAAQTWRTEWLEAKTPKRKITLVAHNKQRVQRYDFPIFVFCLPPCLCWTANPVPKASEKVRHY